MPSTLHLLPYYHHDYAWCNSRSWHIWRYIQAFSETLDLMKTHPDLTLTVDNILHSLREFERYAPDKLAEFASRVREGRICVSSGGMALIRPALFDGELYLRNAADGIHAFCNLFGITPEDMPTFWNADTAPGHSQIPQIMRSLGVQLYRFKRPEASLTQTGVPEVFRWKGLDDSEVLVDRTAYSIGWNTNFQGISEENWEEMREAFIAEHLQARQSRINTSNIIVPFGGDDRLPQRNGRDEPIAIDELIALWNKHEDSRMIYSTPNRFLESIRNETLPVWNGVLDPCELSFNAPFRADDSLWRLRFQTEREILRCERLGTILAAMGGKLPDASFTDSLWQRTYEFAGHAMQFLLNEDYTPILNSARTTLTLAAEESADRAREIASLAGTDTRSRHILINPASTDFDGFAELHVTSERQVQGLRLYDTDGQELPYQLTKIYQDMRVYGRPGQYSEVRALCPVKIPANGYTSVFVELTDARMPSILPESAEKQTIDTGLYSCRIENGKITALSTKNGVLLDAKPFLRLRFVRTKPTDSWYTDFAPLSEAEFVPDSSVLRLNGPFRWELESKGFIGNSPATLISTFERNNPEIRFSLTVDNHENEGFYIADFPCDENPNLFAGIPFGEEPRDSSSCVYTTRKPDAPMSFLDFERGWPGQLWANGYLRGLLAGQHIAVLQGDCDVYYQNLPHSGVLSLLLMKSIDLDARTDRWVRDMSPNTSGKGIQHFTFGFCLADTAPARTFRNVVERFRLPITDCDRYALFSGTAPEQYSAFQVAPSNVTVTSVRHEKDEVILRLYEAERAETECVIHFSGSILGAQCTDLLDRPIEKPVTFSENILSFPMRPAEIVTLHVKL